MTKSRGIHHKRWQWTDDQVHTLKSLYGMNAAGVIAAQIGCKPGQVHRKAQTLGLRKHPAFWISPASGRTKGQRGENTRFKPGLVPWNKGVKGLQLSDPRTRFQKGNRPANAVPIGTLRISHDGLLEMKATEGRGVRNWVGYHRIVWELEHGPIPKGYVIAFREGEFTTAQTEITAEKLMCISQAENMKRNSVHTQYPPEVARLVQLRGALTRQINQREKSNEAN